MVAGKGVCILSIYDYQARRIDGSEQALSDFQGQVLLIVNTASHCVFASQYKDLELLYEKYHEQGFEILAFPCNQFANQEPRTNDQLASFCSINYGITFPLFARVEVKGSGAHPLFRYLTETAKGTLGTPSIKWNFTKFLVHSDGQKIRRFSPATTPKLIESFVKKAFVNH